MKMGPLPNDCSWVRDYSDCEACIELSAVYDDTLKKDDHFTAWAVDVAQAILETSEPWCSVKASWGKWGARLVKGECGTDNEEVMELAARYIVNHYAWQALKFSTHFFTYGT